jgi:endoglucanase
MLEHLEKLCTLNGISGDENEVRNYICSQIEGKCEYHTDAPGNIIAFKKGKKTPTKKLLVDAHMDEVGFIITYIKSDGTLSFASVGGINESVVIGRHVKIGKNKINGVIGSKAVHNLSDDEKNTIPKFKSLYIDIGAENREDAQKYVRTGDSVCFDSEYIKFGDDKIKCKAIDDRAGCAILIDLINSELEYDTYFSFSVQEEVGLRGAKTVSFAVNPDFAVIAETTTASDIAGCNDEKRVCELGKGAVVSFMDKSTVYDKELFRLAFDTADEKNIPCQTKTMVAGGNNSGAIHISGNGVRTLAVSVPCRYLHSPSCVAQYSDIVACEMLIKEMISRILSL